MLSEIMFALALGCSGIVTDLSGDVWHFDNISQLTTTEANNAPCYIVRDGGYNGGVHYDYLSEIIDGRRLDYLCYDGGPVWWLGEQTSLINVKPASRPEAKAFGAMIGVVSSDIKDYEAHGRYGEAFIAEKGIYESGESVACKVVLGEDMVKAIMSTEKRSFVAKMSRELIRMPLNVDRDSLESYTITRRRWFTADEPVLIAVQTINESVPYGEKRGEITSSFYTISPDDFAEIAEKQRSENKDILKDAKVWFDNGIIYISFPHNSNNDGVWVDMSLTSLDGSVYAYGMRFEGMETSQQDVSTLLPGQYMLTLRTPWSEYKQLIAKP